LRPAADGSALGDPGAEHDVGFAVLLQRSEGTAVDRESTPDTDNDLIAIGRIRGRHPAFFDSDFDLPTTLLNDPPHHDKGLPLLNCRIAVALVTECVRASGSAEKVAVPDDERVVWGNFDSGISGRWRRHNQGCSVTLAAAAVSFLLHTTPPFGVPPL